MSNAAGPAGTETLTLKWGTLKGYDLETEASKAALQRYFADPVLMSCARQQDTPNQRQALLDLIECIDGTIENDWTGEMMTKAEARKYVLDYPRSARDQGEEA